jgi:hypothetical protein
MVKLIRMEKMEEVWHTIKKPSTGASKKIL